MSITSLVKKSIRSFGFDIVRIDQKHFDFFDIECVFDVGANAGQYAQSIRDLGYKNKIISFEPLSAAHKILKRNASNDDSWLVHERAALGKCDGISMIHISGNSFSSSLRPMLEEHISAAPESVYIADEEVKVTALDSVFNAYKATRGNNFLKIDTQGYEKDVLDGCKVNLKNFAAVQLELSVVQLYEGAELYDYFFSYLTDNGFEIWDLKPGYKNPKTGRMLQFDGVFINREIIMKRS